MTYRTLSIADAVLELGTMETDILFLDTCMTLDIIRLPNPDRVANATQLQATLDSVERVLAKKQEGALSIVLPCRIVDEWARNADNVRSETERAAKKLEEAYCKFQMVSQRLAESLPDISFARQDLADTLHALSQKVLSKGTHLREDQLSIDRAVVRSFKEIAPSRKGALPDGVVYEQALELVDQLGAQAVGRKIVFATSNTSDFCTNKKPKEPIEAELECRNMSFCTSWPWVVRELGI